jgi:hypothetical protein
MMMDHGVRCALAMIGFIGILARARVIFFFVVLDHLVMRGKEEERKSTETQDGWRKTAFWNNEKERKKE